MANNATLNLDDNSRPSENVSFNSPKHFSQVIGTSAVEVKNPVTNDALSKRGYVLIQALSTNSGTVFIGHDNTVTAADNSGTGGYELAPGAEISMGLSVSSFDTLREIWAIASSAGQEIRVLEK